MKRKKKEEFTGDNLEEINMDNQNQNRNNNNLEGFVNHDDANINQETLMRREREARFKAALKDTYGEMFGGAAELIKGCYDEAGGWLKEYSESTVRGLSIPFAIASAVRRTEDGDPVSIDENGDHKGAQALAKFTIGIGYTGMGLGEIYLIIESAIRHNSDWAYGFGVLAAANVVDLLVYEPVRHAWKMSERR
jgi:hypothetical protein